MGLSIKSIIGKKRKDLGSTFVYIITYGDGKLKIVFTVLQYYYAKKNKKKSTGNLDYNFDPCRIRNGWLYHHSIFSINVKKCRLIFFQMNKQTKAESKSYTFRNLVYVLVAILLLAVLLYITYRLSNQVYRQNQINTEILNLQTQITRLNQENQDLDELIGYLQTDEFKEKEAKDKLNLIKEGEQLVLVKEKELQLSQMDDMQERSKTEVVVHRENYYWWWHYFFNLDSK